MLIQLLTHDVKRLENILVKHQSNDATVVIVLLQNGVYAAQTCLSRYPNARYCTRYYALESDWMAAGLNSIISASDTCKPRLISPEEWVGLCAEHHPIITIQ